MKYYTKEWYSLMQKQDYTVCMKPIADKAYTDADIAALYDKALKAAIARDRKDYNTPPSFIPLDFDGCDLDDFSIFDVENGVLIRPSSFDEVKQQFEQEQAAAFAEFDARPPFDPTETEENFKAMYNGGLEHGYTRFPDYVKNEVDIRLIALGYLPKSVYDRLKKEEKTNKREFNEATRAARKALTEQSKLIPDEILRNFGFHDGEILSFENKNDGIVMTLRECFMPYADETPYTRVTFVDGQIIERDENLVFAHSTVNCGEHEYDAYCTWLYDEIYKTSDGYEAHMLLCERELGYLTIRCRDIKIEKNVDLK